MMAKPSKVVTVVDPSTDREHRHIDNGVFLDGRTKTLKGHGLTQQHQITPTRHANKNKDPTTKKLKETPTSLVFALKKIIITLNGWNINWNKVSELQFI